MKGIRDLTKDLRVTKEKHDDYFRFTINNMGPEDSGTYSIVVKNKFGTDRAFVTVRVSFYLGEGFFAISFMFTPPELF